MTKICWEGSAKEKCGRVRPNLPLKWNSSKMEIHRSLSFHDISLHCSILLCTIYSLPESKLKQDLYGSLLFWAKTTQDYFNLTYDSAKKLTPIFLAVMNPCGDNKLTVFIK